MRHVDRFEAPSGWQAGVRRPGGVQSPPTGCLVLTVGFVAAVGDFLLLVRLVAAVGDFLLLVRLVARSIGQATRPSGSGNSRVAAGTHEWQRELTDVVEGGSDGRCLRGRRT